MDKLRTNSSRQHAEKDIMNLVYNMLFLIMIIRVLGVCLQSGIDPDCYFLINTGKYIAMNKAIPTTNIWTIHEGFKIVVQQWMCCISNYTAYNLAGNTGLVMLSILHIIILNVLLVKLAKLCNAYNKRIVIIVLCIANYLAHYYMNSRPSLVTMCIVTFELIQLEIWNKSSKSKKDNIRLLITLAFISIFHINYHSALWLLDIIFVLPYMTPAIWDIDIHNIKSSLCTASNKRDIKMLLLSILTIVVSALLNPNGIKSMYYLGNAKSVVTEATISELRPWSINTLNSIIIIAVIVLLYRYITKGGKDRTIVYTSIGTIILSIAYKRNFWMLIFGTIKLVVILLNKNNVKKHIVPKRRYIALTSLCTLLIFGWLAVLINQYRDNLNTSVDNVSTVSVAVDYLDSLTNSEKSKLVIYNDFNSGAYLELNGYKTYIDARPELYLKTINGKADIYTEWHDLCKGDKDIPSFIDKYKFNTFVSEEGSLMDCFLYYSEDYSIVADGAGYRVYRTIEN